MRICSKTIEYKRIISLILVISFLFSLSACSAKSKQESEQQVLSEDVLEESQIKEEVIEEDFIYEEKLDEFINEEIYISEILIAEEKINELLIEEETIDEVLLCKTIYVPQDNITEFSENSQTTRLFGENIDISSLLTKVSIGTGVILTLVVLKVVGLPDPVVSVVAAAADESMKFAASGAAIGSLFGGLTGAADEIDETGRASAVIGFATATAGLVLTTLSFIGAVPSGGITSISATAGIKLVIAGISVLAATAGTTYAGYQAVKTFKATDSTKIDWENINWRKVGVSAAEKSIKSTADGYMWGAIIGAVYGGADGLDFYQKYNTPYTKYNARLMQTPKNGDGGKWSGKRGESDYILYEPIKLADGTEIYKVTYQNAVPDFSPYQQAQVKIPKMTNQRYGPEGNFEQADTALAEYWTRINHAGHSWTARDIETYRSSNNLTWHEMSNMESMQLIPRDVNQQFSHYGGVAEYNAMVGQEGVPEFD